MQTGVRNKALRELTDEELMAIVAGGDSDDEPEVDPGQLNWVWSRPSAEQPSILPSAID